MATAWWPLLASIYIADTLYPYSTCYLTFCSTWTTFSVVLYCSCVMRSAFCNGCHILLLITVDRNVICSLTLGWANCGSTCAASAHYAASDQFSPDVTVPARNGLVEAHIVDYSSALSSSSPSSATPPQHSQIVAHPHESLASQSLQQGLSCLSP